MPQVTVWKCPKTKKFFEDTVKYKIHLKTLARKNILSKKNTAIRTGVVNKVLGSNNVNNVQELCEYVAAHNVEFIMAGMENSTGGARDRIRKSIINGHKIIFPEFELIEIKANWEECTPNTHEKPRDGVTNWGSNDALPKGYPGWHGHIITHFASDAKIVIHNGSKSNIISLPSISTMTQGDNCPIRTGTGGGSPCKSRYDIKLFASDLPAMERHVMMLKLRFSDGDKRELTEQLDMLGNGNWVNKSVTELNDK